jgi:benzodiazapine receptor
MTEANGVSGIDKLRSILVLAATIGTIAFNWLAAAGRINGVTPQEVSEQYPTLVTPAGYAFSIWSLIYLGLLAFSIYQLLPSNAAKFKNFRSLYITTCALNCAWIFFWHSDQIAMSFIIIAALLITLLLINIKVRKWDSLAEFWTVNAPFGIYFGWVTAAVLVNFAVLLVYWRVEMSASASTALGVFLILLAAVLAVAVRRWLTNYFYPLAVAWALTAIAVRQSGHTLIVVAAAIGVVACLVASLSFVMNLRSSDPANRSEPI